jgi:hypothetical protein
LQQRLDEPLSRGVRDLARIGRHEVEPVPSHAPRRRRRRAVWRAGAGISRTDETTATTLAPDDSAADQPDDPDRVARPAPAPPPAGPPPAKRRRADPSERGLRDLVGGGPSQLGPIRAMRARDANRPTEDDLAEAAEQVVIVRRHWKPPRA